MLTCLCRSFFTSSHSFEMVLKPPRKSAHRSLSWFPLASKISKSSLTALMIYLSWCLISSALLSFVHIMDFLTGMMTMFTYVPSKYSVPSDVCTQLCTALLCPVLHFVCKSWVGSEVLSVPHTNLCPAVAAWGDAAPIVLADPPSCSSCRSLSVIYQPNCFPLAPAPS